MIDEENNLEQCDQFTKPEEIDALRKYLRAKIDEVNSRTELGSDAVKLSPSYGNQFDPDNESLPESVLGVPQDSDQSRIDKVQSLEDIGNRSPIPSSATNVSIERLTDTNAERLFGEIPSVSLGEERDPIPFQDSIQDEIKLGDYKETIEVNQEYSLDEEKIDVPGEKKSINALSDTKERVEGEFKRQESLSNVLESLTENYGNTESISLGEDNEKLGENFGGEVESLSSYSSSLPGDIKNPEALPTNREKIIGNEHEIAELSDFLSPLTPDEGKQFNAFEEELPNAVLGVPQREEKVHGLNDERINLSEGDFKEPSLSETIEKPSGLYKDLELDKGFERLPKNLGGDTDLLGKTAISIPKDKNPKNNELNQLSDELPEEGIIGSSYNSGSDSISLLNELLSSNIISPNQNPNQTNISELTKDLPKDGTIPEDPRYEEIKSLREILSGDGLVPKNLNPDFENVESLRNKLSKDGTTPEDFRQEEISSLRNTLSDAGLTPHNLNTDYEEIDSLRKDLPDGGITPENLNSNFENIEELRKEIPNGGRTPENLNSDYEDINELREELPEGGKTPSNLNPNYEDIEELRDSLPDGGQIPENLGGDINELRDSLPDGGKTPENLNPDYEDINELRDELPDGGIIPENQGEGIEELRDELPEGGKTPENLNPEYEDINELRDSLPDGGQIPENLGGDINELRDSLPAGGITPENLNPDYEDIEELRDELPAGGITPENLNSDYEDINELREELPEGGKTPDNLNPNFEDVNELREELPAGGKTPENLNPEYEDINELRDSLPDGGITPSNLNSDYEDINELREELPDGGRTPENSRPSNDTPYEDIEELRQELPEGGTTPTNSRPSNDTPYEDIEELRNELSGGGIIPENSRPNNDTPYEDIEELRQELPEGGTTPTNSRPSNDTPYEDIEELRNELSDGGKTPTNLRPEGDIPYEDPDFLKWWRSINPPDPGLTPNERPEVDEIPYEDIEELREFLAEDGKTPVNSRPEIDKTPFWDIEDTGLPDENNFPDGGRTPENSRPFGDSEYEEINSLREFLALGGIIPENSRPNNDTPYEDIEELRQELPEGGTTPTNLRPNGDVPYEDPEFLKWWRSINPPDPGLTPNERPEVDEIPYKEINEETGLPDEKNFPDGGKTPTNSRPANDKTSFWDIESTGLPDEKNFPDGGKTPENFRPANDKTPFWDVESTGLPDAKDFTDGGKTPTNSRPEIDETAYWDIEDTGLLGETSLPQGGKTPENSRPINDKTSYWDIESTGLPDTGDLPTGGKSPENSRPKNDKIPFEEIEELRNIASKGGIVPENTRPDADKTIKIDVEDFSGLDSLLEALKRRSEHDIDGYVKYVKYFAQSKDLSSGLGQKIRGLLSELSTEGFNMQSYKNWEGRLYSAVIEYNSDTKNLARIGYSQIPNSLDAYTNYNSYLRYIVDQSRRLYNSITDKSGFLRKVANLFGGDFLKRADGVLGLKEQMVDSLLTALVQQRDNLERLTQANRDRLPGDGGNGALQDLVRGNLDKALTTFGDSFAKNLTSNVADLNTGFLDMQDPHNRPSIDGNTFGWYSPDYEEPEDPVDKFTDRLKAAASAAFFGSGKAPNYSFQEHYLKGIGIRTTLYDLAEMDLDWFSKHGDVSYEGFLNIIRHSPLITHPRKFTGAPSEYGGELRDGTSYSLDVNSYWEIVIEPYIGKENGERSFLPSIEEINILNEYQHGVRTYYGRWMPIVQFDLSRSRTTSKSINLFGGEFTIPGGIDFTNELRISLVDDSFKSWRRYFEKCNEVGVYSSRIHGKEFYGWTSDGTCYDAKTAMGSNYADWKMITSVDRTSFALAPYKNITFRIRIYIMTPQYSTINKYDLLAILKEFSVERQGEIDPNSQDLELNFSIVGETDESCLPGNSTEIKLRAKQGRVDKTVENATRDFRKSIDPYTHLSYPSQQRAKVLTVN